MDDKPFKNITILPLHYGKAPRWLFSRMKNLGKSILDVIIDEFGVEGFFERIADPFWFQSLSNCLGYDWHSSGSTSVTLAALREIFEENAESYGIFIAGGKGKKGLATPKEIKIGCERLNCENRIEDYVLASRLAAKVDSSLVYDNFSLYCHFFIFSKNSFSVVQQGMFNEKDIAARFQWYSGKIKDYVNEPHVVTSDFHEKTLDLTYSKNSEVRNACVWLVREDFQKLYCLPKDHELKKEYLSEKVLKILKDNRENIEKYEDLLLLKNVGRKTLRSLALISKLIYDKEIYERDPALFSFTVGGKDGTPYRINKRHYDEVISQMRLIVENAKFEDKEKYKVLKRLAKL
ncbi:MAG: DUF763 domain-containing protein [archaeon]